MFRYLYIISIIKYDIKNIINTFEYEFKNLNHIIIPSNGTYIGFSRSDTHTKAHLKYSIGA